MFKTLHYQADVRGVATLTLNRPEKHNAMSSQMITELTQAALQIDADQSVRVVVLKGQGPSFCAGGDLGWMRAQMEGDRATRAVEARKLADMLGALNRLSKPLLAYVHGNVFGGGVGLCCVCDKVFADNDAVFGLTETKLGLIPATIGPYVVARLGGGLARQVFMSSRSFPASEALRLGVVSTRCDAQYIDDALETEIQAYLKCAPAAVAEAKAMVLELGGAPSDALIKASIDALLQRWQHPEAHDGITAFFDKTLPPWV